MIHYQEISPLVIPGVAPRSRTSLRAIGLLSIGVCYFVALDLRAEIIGNASLVDDACVAYEVNLAKLRTWVAEIEVRHDTSTPSSEGPPNTGSQTDEVWMAFDRDLPAFLVRWRCIESTKTTNGATKRGGNDTCEWGEMIVDGNVYKITIYDPRKDTAKHGPSIVTGVAERTKPSGPFEERIVPMELFWHQQRPLSDYLRTVLDITKRFPGHNLEVSRDGQLLNAKTAIAEPRTEEEFAIDLAKGGIVIKSTYRFDSAMERTKVTQEQHMDLTEVNGVWVPSHIKRARIETGENGERNRETHRELKWKTNLVNVEIPRSQFTVDAFREGKPARLLNPQTLAITNLPDQNAKQAEEKLKAAAKASGKGRSILVYVLAAFVPLILIALFSWRLLGRR